MMPEQKWAEFSNRIERLVSEYKKIKKERDELKTELAEFKKQTTKLVKDNKSDLLLKDRIKVLEEDREIIQEKVKALLKILKEY